MSYKVLDVVVKLTKKKMSKPNTDSKKERPSSPKYNPLTPSTLDVVVGSQCTPVWTVYH